MNISSFLLVFLSIYFIVRSNNLIFIFCSTFVFLYGVNVLVLNYYLDIPFSPSQGKFDSLDNITLSLLLFLVISWFIFGRIKIDFESFVIKKTTSRLDLFKGSIVIFYGLFLFIQKGFRLGGEFMDSAGDRSILEDYIALLFVIFFLSSRASKFLIFSFVFISISYFVAGERLRMFIYIGSVVVYLFRERLTIIKICLPFAYVFAEFISLFRSQTDFGIKDNGVFTSHFGSVTISSLYLNEFISPLFFVDKFQYYIGIIIGNIIPTFLLPDGFDVRGDLFKSYDIPGGGWFPSFILSVSNWYVFILTILMIGLIVRFCIKHKSLYSDYFIFIMIITSPRWFMYSPYLIFRFALYSIIIIIFLKTLQKFKHG
jgi:hypothetical protein